MHYEGPKRKGRFIKATAKVLKHLALEEFSFSDIGDAKVIAPDNAKRTIVHSQYHEPSEIEGALKPLDRFNVDFSDDDSRRPIIMPTDFTEEWERDRKMRKDRVARMDDDEYEFDFETAQRQALEKQRQDEEKALKGDAKVEPSLKQVEDQVSLDNQVASQTSGEDLKAAGLIIKGLHPEEGDTPRVDEFIPINVSQKIEANFSAEDSAIEDYKSRVEVAKVDQKKLDEIYQEAEARGYREGFRVGEEKAEIQVKDQSRALFNKVGEIVHELASLKHAVLENVQENFYEVAQALAEALLQREFTIHPETFQAVIKRAISDSIDQDQFKIRVSPKMFERLHKLENSEFKDLLIKDKSLNEFDFKVDSNLSIVDVSISKMLTDLLEKADLGLFDEKGKAS